MIDTFSFNCSYFSDFLKVHGPLAIDDVKIQQELEVFPLEAQEKIKAAGGLGDFLRQDFKFAVIEDVISLMTDAVKARQIALKRRDERVNQGKLPQVQDAWKTVGKDKDVDSLKESVTNSAPNSRKTSYVSALSNNPNKTQYSQDVSHSSLLVDQSGKHAASLANSNSSNSLSSVDSSAPPMKHFSEKASDKQPEASLEEIHENHNGFSVDALDSIDDFPLPDHEVKSKIDDLDDFDIYPDTASSISDKGSERSKAGNAKHESGLLVGAVSSRNSISDSSSDISETSDIFVDTPKLVVGGMPKPLKPLNRFGPGFAPASKTELENDFRDFRPPVTSIDSEIKRLADDYIKNTDEKLMSEIADSVVEKIYSGKSVSDVERANTLKQVSDDIRKDFEKSAKSGGSGIWADTPASADYSKNIGKFATDFMKSHYQKENIVLSPTSDPGGSTYFQQSPSIDSNKLNSPLNMTSETRSETRSSFPSTLIPSSSSNVYTSGYNLFSGPSIGLDSLSSPRSVSPHFSRSPQTFIRPPPAAATYYSSVPPPAPIGPRPPLTPLRMPSFHAVLKIDKETQVVSAVCASVETMTEPLDMVELEMYLQVKDDFERMTREMARFKERIAADVQKLEGKNKVCRKNLVLSILSIDIRITHPITL